MNTDRVLLALYWLADAEGLYCHGTDRQLAEAAGRSVSTVRTHLRALQDAGHVAAWWGREKIRHPAILLDHPDADRARREVKRYYVDPERKMRRIMAGRER